MGVPSRTSAPTPALDQTFDIQIILGKVRPFLRRLAEAHPQVLIIALSTPQDVVDFFAAPWKWNKQFQIWALAGRPLPPSPDDLAQARMLGHGTLRQELERRYQDDTAQWESLTTALDELDSAPAPDQLPDHATSTVRAFPKRPRKK